MEKLLISSFKDNFIQRTKNPLLSIWILIVLYDKWEVFYKIYGIGKAEKIIDKIDPIKAELKLLFEPSSLLSGLLCAIGILLITKLIVVISIFIADFFKKIVIPYVELFNDWLKHRLKNYSFQDYERLLNENRILEKQTFDHLKEIENLANDRNNYFSKSEILNLSFIGSKESLNKSQNNFGPNVKRRLKIVDELIDVFDKKSSELLPGTSEFEISKGMIERLTLIKNHIEELFRNVDSHKWFLVLVSVEFLYQDLCHDKALRDHIKTEVFTIETSAVLDNIIKVLELRTKQITTPYSVPQDRNNVLNLDEFKMRYFFDI